MIFEPLIYSKMIKITVIEKKASTVYGGNILPCSRIIVHSTLPLLMDFRSPIAHSN